MPGAKRVVRAARGTGPGITPGSVPSSCWRPNGNRPRCTCGIAGPGAQRSRAAVSTTSRLSHPVSPRLPRLAVGPRGALLVLHAYYSARHAKGPLPAGKGPWPAKTSSGAGFEPSTSGLWAIRHRSLPSQAVSGGCGDLDGQDRSHLALSGPSPPSQAVSPRPVYKSVYRTGYWSALSRTLRALPWLPSLGRGTAPGLAKRLPSGAASTRNASLPLMPDTGPHGAQSSSPLPGLHWGTDAPLRVQTPPPNPTAAGPDGRRVLSRVGAADHAVTPKAPWTGSGWREYSYGGFGGGHPPFRPHTFPRPALFL